MTSINIIQNSIPLQERWHDIDTILTRQSTFVQPGFIADNIGEHRMRQLLLERVRVLVIGAGGLGCELLKDLALVGFTNIEVIDMDTIDYSNLNRQFLFRTGDVSKPKAQVAAEFVNKRIPGAKVVGHYDRIENKSDDFYRQFHIIIAGLDSINARRWINITLCRLVQKIVDPQTGETTKEWDLGSVIPLIDGGTEGFMGQSRVILPRFTACFECLLHLFPPDPLNFQECTLVSTPRQPQHCISWAMRFAWKDDPTRADIKINGDDPEHIQWLYEAALNRAIANNIDGVTLKLTQGVVKRIIPAIASTNAIISASCATEAFKLATQCALNLKDWMMYNGSESVFTSTTTFDRNEDCLVCSLTGATIRVDKQQSLEDFIKLLINDKDKFLNITNPSLMREKPNGEKGFLYMTGYLSSQTKPNLPKLLGELLDEGDTVTITNRDNQGRDSNYIVKILWKNGDN